MYLSTEHGAALEPRAGRPDARVPRTVLALGLVSLFTDVSAEMVTALLPLYLLYGLGVGYLQFGLVDGLYTGATTLLRLAGGHAADRLGRPKAVALAGYGLSAVTKLGFPLAGPSVGGIGALLAADRAGKGIRTAPRDALISLAAPPSALGRAFGLHRTLDTTGALLGPLVTFALLALVGTRYDSVFVVSFCFAAIGLVILIGFVPEATARPVATAPSSPAGVRAAVAGLPGSPAGVSASVFGLLGSPAGRRICGCAGLLGLVTISDAFLFVAAQQGAGLGSDLLPLLPLGTALAFLLAAVPVGRLADRVGRLPVFLAGHAVLLGACLLVLAPGFGAGALVVVLGLHGLFYAATDGVLMAHVGPLLPASRRAGGLAVVQTVQAMARMVAAVGFGVVAQFTGLGTAMACFTTGLAAATVTAWLVLRQSRPFDPPRRDDQPTGPGEATGPGEVTR